MEGVLAVDVMYIYFGTMDVLLVVIALLSETLATGCVCRVDLRCWNPCLVRSVAVGCGLSRTHRRSMFDRQPILSHGRGVMIARGIRDKTCTWLGGSCQGKSSRKECDVQLFNIVICKLEM